MKKYIYPVIILFLTVAVCNAEEGRRVNINIKIGDKNYPAILFDNVSSREFIKKLPLTLTMNDLNGNEKYAVLPEKLSAHAVSIDTISAGDLMLYGGDTFVLFYKSFPTSYRYTRLGRILNASGLQGDLGGGSIKITINN